MNKPKLIAKFMRMFSDENLTSFFRRLAFSPDGSLLVVPAGLAKEEGETSNESKPRHVVYVYTRGSIAREPIFKLVGHKTAPIAIRFNPNKYHLNVQNDQAKPYIGLSYRYIFAVATQDSVVIYDTQQTSPIAFLSNLHYATFTDVAWSMDGRTLMLASTDGFCSLVEFEANELGTILHETIATVNGCVEENKENAIADDDDKKMDRVDSGVQAKVDTAEQKVSSIEVNAANKKRRITPMLVEPQA